MNRRPLNSLPLGKAITGFVNYKTAEDRSKIFSLLRTWIYTCEEIFYRRKRCKSNDPLDGLAGGPADETEKCFRSELASKSGDDSRGAPDRWNASRSPLSRTFLVPLGSYLDWVLLYSFARSLLLTNQPMPTRSQGQGRVSRLSRKDLLMGHPLRRRFMRSMRQA